MIGRGVGSMLTFHDGFKGYDSHHDGSSVDGLHYDGFDNISGFMEQGPASCSLGLRAIYILNSQDRIVDDLFRLGLLVDKSDLITSVDH